jgi:hypothetical protein
VLVDGLEAFGAVTDGVVLDGAGLLAGEVLSASIAKIRVLTDLLLVILNISLRLHLHLHTTVVLSHHIF